MTSVANLRIGVVGAGGIAASHVGVWRKLGVDLAIFSRRPAIELAHRFGARTVDSLSELIAWADVVDIITPTDTHHGIALQAINAGKHVICEKPLAATAGLAREMFDAAAASGVLLLPAHVVRYFPEYVRAKTIVTGGKIGEVVTATLSRSGQAPSKPWFFDESVGGGIVRDQMIHDLDQARELAGEVVQVYAVQNPPSRNGQVPPVVAAQVVLTHASGAISHVHGHWGPVGLPFRTGLRVRGTAGILGDDDEKPPVTADLPALAESVSYLPPQDDGPDPFEEQLTDFLTAIEGGQTARVSAWDGVVAVALADAAMASIASGRAIRFDESAADIGISAAAGQAQEDPPAPAAAGTRSVLTSREYEDLRRRVRAGELGDVLAARAVSATGPGAVEGTTALLAEWAMVLEGLLEQDVRAARTVGARLGGDGAGTVTTLVYPGGAIATIECDISSLAIPTELTVVGTAGTVTIRPRPDGSAPGR